MPRRIFRTRDELERIARERFGYGGLRPAQREVIELVLAGHDTMAVMPTGSGKSAIYQIAALLKAGPTVVISPLLALQQDQLESIQDRPLPDAAAVNSSVPASARREALENVEQGELEYLFLGPEQLARSETREQVLKSGPSLFVVDEAHCVSEWGHDFRPDYLRLKPILEALGHPTVLALTATASEHVRQDIVAGIGMWNPKIVVTGFDRPNISVFERSRTLG